MNINIWSPSTGTQLFELEKDIHWGELHPDGEFNVAMDHAEAKGTFREVYQEGLVMSYGAFYHPNPVQINFESDVESVEMHFLLKGHTLTHDYSNHQFCQFDSNEQNLMFASGFRGSTEIHSDGHSEFFEINFQPERFIQLLPQDHHLFDTFRKKIENQHNAMLGPRNQTLTPRMRAIIQELMNCQRTGAFRKLFMESKAMELMMYQFEGFRDQAPRTYPGLSQRQVDMLHGVRDLIHTHPQSAFTLSSLAREVGTNVFTLKKGFKQVFGETVFGYWNRLKMDRAKHLLLDTQLSVKEVADQVGYQHPQHFSTAFKKHFGVSPRKMAQS